MIEFAQMEPPNHQMSPMRVLLKIQKGESPKLDNPKAWSADFNNFIAKCLIKDFNTRPTAAELLEHPFLKTTAAEDKRTILPLIIEYKAEVVEELTEVNDEEVFKNNIYKFLPYFPTNASRFLFLWAIMPFFLLAI